MKHVATCVTVTLGLVLLGAAPADGQLWFFPDYAVPSGGDTPTTWIAGGYARGLNDASGKTDGFAGAIGRTTGQVSFVGAVGFMTGPGDDELTLGGALGVDLIKNQDSPVQLTLQGGIGWLDFDAFGGETLTLWRFPIGLALKGTGGDSPTKFTPWIMPRLNIIRASGLGESDTDTDLGVSGGLAITTESGFGVHAALDYLAVEGDAPWLLGVGVHFLLGQGN